MFSKKGRIVYFASILIFLIYLMMADSIVTLGDAYKLSENKFIDIDFKKSNLLMSVSEMKFGTDLKETFSISGWAFAESEYDNTQKQIKVAFKSDKKLYVADAGVTSWKNLYKQFNNPRIKGDNAGFRTYFSTINMDYGIYEIYLLCIENSYDYAIKNTYRKIIRDKDGIREYLPSKVQNLNNVIPTDEVTSTLNKNIIPNKEGDSYLISGVASIKGKDTMQQEVFLELTDAGGQISTYDTIMVERSDLGEQGYYMGFKTYVPIIDFAQDFCAIRIIVSNDGFYCDNMDRVCVAGVIAEHTVTRVEPLEDVVQTQEAIVRLDNHRLLSDNSYTISGWAAMQNRDTQGQKIYVEITDTTGDILTYEAAVVDRPDLGEGMLSAGFQLNVPAYDLLDDGYSMRIIISSQGFFWNGEVVKLEK